VVETSLDDPGNKIDRDRGFSEKKKIAGKMGGRDQDGNSTPNHFVLYRLISSFQTQFKSENVLKIVTPIPQRNYTCNHVTNERCLEPVSLGFVTLYHRVVTYPSRTFDGPDQMMTKQ
jgi:hypothetical protein